MIVCRFVIQGVVQGVGFRYFARHAALELGLAGYVRNLPDGSVEAAAAGPAAAVSHFEDRLRTGPPGSRVTSVERIEISDELVLGNTFEVKF